MKLIAELSNDLAIDPAVALVEFMERAETALKRKSISESDKLSILLFFEKFIEKYKVGPRVKFDEKVTISQKLDFFFREIKGSKALILHENVSAEVDALLQGYSDQRDKNSFGFAKFNDEEKVKLHAHIFNIRKIIDESKLPDRKKNALYERLSDLSREADMRGTRTDRFFAFAGDVGFVLGDMATKAKPMFSEVKDLLRIVSRARARQEGVSLPSGDEVLSLTGPVNDETK